MASPAQVANDLDIRAKFWRGRDGGIEGTCRTGARVIRCYLDEVPPDGRTTAGVLTRLYRLVDTYPVLSNPDLKASLARAAQTISDLRMEASA